jgi:dienelactone hydrolase
MSVCCPPGGLGRTELCDRTPQGRLITWSPLKVADGSEAGSSNLQNRMTNHPRKEVSCYHVGPETNPRRVVVVFTDVFGLDSGNHKAFCDVLQKKLGDDTAVYCPDLFRGNPLMHDYGPLLNRVTLLKVVWGLRTRCSATNIDADLRDIVEPNVLATGCLMCGVVGFCFGGCEWNC